MKERFRVGSLGFSGLVIRGAGSRYRCEKVGDTLGNFLPHKGRDLPVVALAVTVVWPHNLNLWRKQRGIKLANVATELPIDRGRGTHKLQRELLALVVCYDAL